MFVLNGIVYASEKRNDIEVISVKPLDDMIMILTFSTGEQRLCYNIDWICFPSA